MAFFAEVKGFVKDNEGDPELKPYVEGLARATGHLEQATMWFMANAMGNPDNAGAGSTDYMHLFGLVGMAYMWALIAKAAKDKLPTANGEAGYYQAKLATGRYFVERVLPESGAHLARITTGAATMMAMPVEAF